MQTSWRARLGSKGSLSTSVRKRWWEPHCWILGIIFLSLRIKIRTHKSLLRNSAFSSIQWRWGGATGHCPVLYNAISVTHSPINNRLNSQTLHPWHGLGAPGTNSAASVTKVLNLKLQVPLTLPSGTIPALLFTLPASLKNYSCLEANH